MARVAQQTAGEKRNDVPGCCIPDNIAGHVIVDRRMDSPDQPLRFGSAFAAGLVFE